MATPGRFNGRALTNHLRTLAGQITVDHFDEVTGDLMTREQALAQLLWRQALGWVEETTDENGTAVKKKHLPVGWAQQFMWERMEGKAPVSTPEGEGGLKASDKVRELAKQRLNNRAAALANAAKPSGPPVFRKKS